MINNVLDQRIIASKSHVESQTFIILLFRRRKYFKNNYILILIAGKMLFFVKHIMNKRISKSQR